MFPVPVPVPVPCIAVRCIGVKIDENINRNEHVEMICNKAEIGMGAMERTKKLQNLLALNEFLI